MKDQNPTEPTATDGDATGPEPAQSIVSNPFAPSEDVPKEAVIRGKRSAAIWGMVVGLFFALMLVLIIFMASFAFGS
jgi:hypothetical protein